MNKNNIGQKIIDLDIPKHVKLIAVSKKKPISMIKEVYDSGQRFFGENRVQDAVKKIDQLKNLKNIEWHFIGNLQSNKAKIAAEYFDVIQSIDSLKLVKKLNDACLSLNKVLNVMIEINIGEESQKGGIRVSELEDFLKVFNEYKNLKLIGLMCIPPFGKDPSSFYQKMKVLFDKYKNSYNMTELSMGMSSDYKIAIEYGATMVRIGTIIFGPR